MLTPALRAVGPGASELSTVRSCTGVYNDPASTENCRHMMGSFPFNLLVTAVPDVRIFMCARSLAALRSVTIHQYRNRNVIVKLATVHGTMLKIFERYRNWNFTVLEERRVHAVDLDCLLSGFQLLVKFSSTALALFLIHSWRALVLGSFPVIK